MSEVHIQRLQFRMTAHQCPEIRSHCHQTRGALRSVIEPPEQLLASGLDRIEQLDELGVPGTGPVPFGKGLPNAHRIGTVTLEKMPEEPEPGVRAQTITGRKRFIAGEDVVGQSADGGFVDFAH